MDGWMDAKHVLSDVYHYRVEGIFRRIPLHVGIVPSLITLLIPTQFGLLLGYSRIL